MEDRSCSSGWPTLREWMRHARCSKLCGDDGLPRRKEICDPARYRWDAARLRLVCSVIVFEAVEAAPSPHNPAAPGAMCMHTATLQPDKAALIFGRLSSVCHRRNCDLAGEQ
jgi:hypothetical protein